MTFFYDPKTPVDPNTPEKTTRDGVVDGDNNANVINAAYTGDPEGDKIDNNDAIIGTDTGDQDIVDARGGDDKVYAGADDDEVYAGAGNDTVYGGTGDDLIYGDSGYTGGTIGKTTGDENMFRWSELPDPDGSWHGKVDDGDDLENMTLTQQVGGVKVTVTTPPRPSWHSNGLETEFDNEAIYVGGLKDSINTRSSLESEADNGESGTYKIGFDKAVDQVRFNITDIDADVGYVRVLAYGPDGTLIPVDFQAGSGLSVGANNTITANDDHQDARTDADAAVTVTITGPVSRIEVIHAGDGHGQSNIYISDIGIVETFETIEGTDGEATAAQGAGADFLNGDAGNDTIYGQGGDDTINGGDDDDLLVGGSGNDSIDGGSGNDVIYGDNAGETPPSSTETVRESFEWDQAGVANGHDLDGFTQNTGNVNVTFKILQETGAADTEFSTDQQKVHSIKDDGKGVDAYSSLDSETKGQGNQADYELSFSDAVENVSFRVNDIDGDGVVRIRAYDANGKEINVDMTGGAKLTLIDSDGKFGVDTADSNGGYEEDTSGNYSILVDIPGPVSRITIEHDQNGSNNSGINVTDIYFDAKVGVPAGEDGNDVLNGGDGDDMIFGEGGNDTLTGGQGDDTLSGGDDADVIFGGAGDVVDGGAGGFDVDPAKNTDNDTLDLTGQGPFYITDKVVDSNGNGFNGTIVFVDGDGKPTGDTLTFTEVENIIGDEVNRGPDAMDDTATTDEDTAVTIDVLANDTDPDGDTLTIKSATVSADQGTVEIVDNKLVFTPAENFNGDATITYVVQDGNGGEDTGEAVVTVNPVNDDPVAVDDTATTDEDTAVTVDVLANDTDVDGDTLTIKSATVPADQGTVEIVDNKLVFTPAENFNGDATITYVVQDGNGGEDTGEAVVTVNPVNDDPVAVDDTATTDEDTAVTVDVLANDTDVDGDTLTIKSATVPADQGTVEIVDNKLVFTPAENFNGDATITYVVQDGNGGEDTGEAVVTVTPVNDDPVAVDDTATTDENTAVTIDVLANDTDVDGDTLTIKSATVPADQGTVDIVDNKVVFTPATDFVGDATITYVVQDGNGGEDTGEAVVTVNNVNDAPDAVDDVAATFNQDPVLIDALANDTDPDGDKLTITNVSVPAALGVAIIQDNKVLFTPAADYEGIVNISYTVEDPSGASDTANIQVTVNDGIVSGTAGNDLINAGYTGDVGGDMVDAGDNEFSDDPTKADDDIIEAGDGNDTVFAGNGNDLVNGGEGNDSLNGGMGNDTLNGEGGNDTINGGAGDDLINGGAGDDVIKGGDGSDTIYGGDGNDVITSSDPDNDFKIDKGYPGLFTGEEGTPAAENERDFVDGGAGNDTISTGDDRDTVYGGTGNDVIDAGIDDDEVYGDDGDDRIVGGEGSDIIYGGIGNDTIYAGNDPLKVPDSTNIEDDGSNPFGADKRQDNGRDTVYGGAGNDVIYGADDDDLLYGDEGDDYIDGEIDDDTIFGGVGNDTLMGGQGNDEIDGGEGNDYINAGRNADTVYGGAGNDTIFGENGADKLYGGDGDDWIDGGTGDDTLDGGDGDDMIIGATGDDVMTGGAGNDTIDGGNGGDDMMSGGDGRDTFLNANAGDTVDGGTGGDDFDTLDLTGAGKYEYVSRTVDADGDSTSGTIRFLNADGTSKGTLDFYEIESIIPCFTPGTLIATPKGERRVEDLQVGDRVITRDNGIQEIRWVGQKAMTGAEFERAEHLKPVLIQKGALGGGLPERDMMVSPNHRVLVANDKTALYFEEREVLVAAKHLTGLKGVDIVDVSATTYIHLMFDQHEVILSDGAWTESFQPGDLTLAGIGNAQRNELFELFPELKTREGIDAYTSARRSLKKHEAVLLTK
ncbi:tandem-95 repeat protein [Sulfitobacter pseudonitzschiae]|nr:tandem-95 repeat protein [Pseudosulfitobacter pseudonitzschiae]MBM1926376.1 tandem-95 repeat protein [Pseudosulfitobacter pseudonitzschiae]MBM2018341.1 tandem-95 repeat protein [Pseudosulfitobacter pseudonitzschiae]MBM2042529.1 tandem-95 repeat protein [Pseudosulfitobacter pseudonitzschiae]